jgi:hypothetical protein
LLHDSILHFFHILTINPIKVLKWKLQNFTFLS